MRHEVSGDQFWRYQRNISPGLQEYIEALGFTHYLEHGTLVSLDEVQCTLSDQDGEHVRYFHSCSYHNNRNAIFFGGRIVLPSACGGLSAGAIGFDRGIDEVCDIWYCEERWSDEGK